MIWKINKSKSRARIVYTCITGGSDERIFHKAWYTVRKPHVRKTWSNIRHIFKPAITKLTKQAEIDKVGQTSDTVSNMPSPESIDKAETALHYHNQRKGH